MRLHANARLGPRGRQVMVERVLAGWPAREAAEAAGVSARPVASGSLATDAKARSVCTTGPRSPTASRPARARACPGDLRPSAGALQRPPDRRDAWQCRTRPSRRCSSARGWVASGVLATEPANRYQRDAAGRADPHRRQEARAHLGRRRPPGHRSQALHRPAHRRRRRARDVVGWECVHVAIDDATRLAYAEVLADETARRASASSSGRSPSIARHGIAVERLMTDNGAPTSAAHAAGLSRLGLASHPHPTLPAPDQRQGRAVHPHDARRVGLRGHLPIIGRAHRAPWRGFLIRYNHHRPHSALGHRPPAARLAELRNNAPGPYT